VHPEIKRLYKWAKERGHYPVCNAIERYQLWLDARRKRLEQQRKLTGDEDCEVCD